MVIYTLKTSRGGRPRIFYDLDWVLNAARENLIKKRDGTGRGKIIIEVKKEGD